MTGRNRTLWALLVLLAIVGIAGDPNPAAAEPDVGCPDLLTGLTPLDHALAPGDDNFCFDIQTVPLGLAVVMFQPRMRNTTTVTFREAGQIYSRTPPVYFRAITSNFQHRGREVVMMIAPVGLENPFLFKEFELTMNVEPPGELSIMMYHGSFNMSVPAGRLNLGHIFTGQDLLSHQFLRLDVEERATLLKLMLEAMATDAESGGNSGSAVAAAVASGMTAMGRYEADLIAFVSAWSAENYKIVHEILAQEAAHPRYP